MASPGASGRRITERISAREPGSFAATMARVASTAASSGAERMLATDRSQGR